jgi:hypothetical protein
LSGLSHLPAARIVSKDRLPNNQAPSLAGAKTFACWTGIRPIPEVDILQAAKMFRWEVTFTPRDGEPAAKASGRRLPPDRARIPPPDAHTDRPAILKLLSPILTDC